MMPPQDRLRELRAKIVAFQEGTQCDGPSKQEFDEVETIQKTLNVVLAELDALAALDASRPALDDVYIPERDGRRCVEHPTGDHELACVTCLEASLDEREATIRAALDAPKGPRE